VRLTADLSAIPENTLTKEKGKDGKMYYAFSFSIEVTYLSARTKYELVHNGKLTVSQTETDLFYYDAKNNAPQAFGMVP
jgi:hypothetical protein